MDNRNRTAVKRFSAAKGMLLLAGIVAAGVLFFYSGAVRSHHHDAGPVQLAHSGCGGHAGCGHTHQACSDSGEDKDEVCGHGKACPLLKSGEGDGDCPLKNLLGNRVVCPVMEDRVFTPDENTTAVEHGGRIYLLCCPPCEERFEADPESYTGHHKH